MIRLSPGGEATPAGRRAAETSQRLFRDELPRVRSAATAWRSGLAGLLVGLLGFSLIKGRSDVGQLASPWNVVVGILLFAALCAGTAGALALLWSAYGRPQAIDRRKIGTALSADHQEAVRAVRALRRGIVLSLLCAALLVNAVAVTWYGPAKSKPKLQVITPAARVCGSPVTINAGVVILNTDGGNVTIDLRTATAINGIDRCPTA